MTSTTSRLLLLLSLLQTRRDWPGQLLAERLEISHRTVRRDVDRLRGMGYRIGSAKGPDGGYRLDAGTELPPLLFDDEQVVALTLALRAASVTGVGAAAAAAAAAGGAADAAGASGVGGDPSAAGIGEAALRALTTVRQVMPARLRHRVDALQFTSMPPLSATPADPVSPDTLIALSAAIRARELLRFDYARHPGSPPASATEPPAPRRVEPHHLVHSAGRWYLVAWELQAADWRIFRADRITPRTPTGPRFAPRELPGGDVHAFIAARFRGSPPPGSAAPGSPAPGSATPGSPPSGSRAPGLPPPVSATPGSPAPGSAAPGSASSDSAAPDALPPAAAALAAAWPCVGTVILHLPAHAVYPYAADAVVEPLDADRTTLTAGSWSWVALAAAFARFDAAFDIVGPPALTAAAGTLASRLSAATP